MNRKLLLLEYFIVLCFHLVLLLVLFVTPISLVSIPLFFLYIPFLSFSLFSIDNKIIRNFLWNRMDSRQRLALIMSVRYSILKELKDIVILKFIHKGFSEKEIVDALVFSYSKKEKVYNDIFIDLGFYIDYSRINKDIDEWTRYINLYLGNDFMQFLQKEECVVENQIFKNFINHSLDAKV